MPQEPASIWAATAAPAPQTPAIAGTHRADVLVVGAGFTGLTAALRLAEGGASVIVLDAGAPGFGASGRNGGQVIPGLKYDPDTLDAMFGEATTDFVGKAADTAFALIEKHAIACEPRRSGWIQASVKTSHLPVIERRMAAWAKRGAAVELFDAAAMARETGGQGFAGGWIDRRAGILHPLDYARGLARVALAAGARIHGGSRVVKLARDGSRWTATTQTGAVVSAEQAILATNGYTDGLWPGLKATVIPASSFQVATAPLPADLLARILPGRPAVSDTRRIGNYFRIGPGNRLMMGGRGSFGEPTGLPDYHRILKALHGFFPQVRDLPIDFHWSGRVAMTRDHLPHLHRPFPNLTIALGYNGRGVAMASALGTAIGAHLLHPAAPLPLAVTRIAPMPVHDLHPLYATAAIHYYRLRDALEH
ncbi:NAD(P)/FAD-dependent oxidoreductase [Azorhizobium doebereinerae]|uniref:NAD(P)/FAD-dependent oxidoreductase n=1 Tax=Azorhizobium doebereinerae TaxID=281091 RepID=UPI000427A823|nr:FAD-dependent oxidoreductase [Azorhizobium doebereinerae]